MINILWQSKSKVVVDSFRENKLSQMANGGNAYDYHAAKALAEAFAIRMDNESVLKAGESLLSYWSRLKKQTTDAQVVIMEPYPIVFGKKTKTANHVGMIHHIDDDLGRSTLKHRWYFSTLKKRLRELDLVVTVSGFWKDYLTGIGCSNVKIIYNSFDPSEFIFSPEEISRFKELYKIKTGTGDRPLIYIGLSSRQKGVYEVYKALKDEGFDMIMSGQQNLAADLPVRYLKPDRRDYLILLHLCDAVISFSKMTEGWNRISHEALLCGTPVIGNGVGGMKELLVGAGQPVVSDPAMLANKIREVLQDRSGFAAKGFRFVRRFDMDYFKNEWIKTIRDLPGLSESLTIGKHVRN